MGSIGSFFVSRLGCSRLASTWHKWCHPNSTSLHFLLFFADSYVFLCFIHHNKSNIAPTCWLLTSSQTVFRYIEHAVILEHNKARLNILLCKVLLIETFNRILRMPSSSLTHLYINSLTNDILTFKKSTITNRKHCN